MAHNLKGGAATVGANRLSTVAAGVETACQAGDWRKAAGLLPTLGRQSALLKQAMLKFAKTLQCKRS